MFLHFYVVVYCSNYWCIWNFFFFFKFKTLSNLGLILQFPQKRNFSILNFVSIIKCNRDVCIQINGLDKIHICLLAWRLRTKNYAKLNKQTSGDLNNLKKKKKHLGWEHNQSDGRTDSIWNLYNWIAVRPSGRLCSSIKPFHPNMRFKEIFIR